MLNKFKSAVNNVMSNVPVLQMQQKSLEIPSDQRDIKFPYNRPEFLHLDNDEVQVSADHTTRPILVPRDVTNLPWKAGYAETINGGKSKWNEDQARAGTFFVRGPGSSDDTEEQPADTGQQQTPAAAAADCDGDIFSKDPLPFTYFAIFDGHAGTGASLMAVNMLHNFIQARLQEVRGLLILKRYAVEETKDLACAGGGSDNGLKTGYVLRQRNPSKLSQISADQLVCGTLEAAFMDMDTVIAQESAQYKITGGCTALVAIFFLGKLYIVNAGDCRAVILHENKVHQLSSDFTPEYDRQRIQHLAKMKPELLHNEFCRLEFEHRPTRKDLGQQVLYRDSHMTGWAYKTIVEEDLRIPLIYGEGKKARVLATIGVTRGFGDHDLAVLDTEILIKPFLTAQPEVQIYDLSKHEHGDEDVLILGSDGLWDVIPNEKALLFVRQALRQLDPEDPMRYTSAAQDLVMHARGLLRRGWRTVDELPASYDDISCFIIPLHVYGQPLSKASSQESSFEAVDTEVTEEGGEGLVDVRDT